MTLLARRVEDGKPRLMHRIEAARRNFLQCTSHCFLSVLAVDVEQLADGGFIYRFRRSDLFSDAMQPLGKRITDARETFSADAGIVFKATVMGCRFEFFERVDAQVFMKPQREGFSDPWHRR